MTQFSTRSQFRDALITAHSSEEINAILHAYINEAAENWWRHLDSKEQQALQLLDFDATVATSLMFFTKYHEFLDDYIIIALDVDCRAEKLAAECDYDYRSCLDHRILGSIAGSHVELKEAKESARNQAMALAANLCMDGDAAFELAGMAIRKSGYVKERKRVVKERVNNLRKDLLHDSLEYLRQKYGKDE